MNCLFTLSRLRLTSTVSPCGSYVVAGSEDGSVHWFDLERGDLVALLSLGCSHPITAISFHPCSHLMVLCSLNADQCFTLMEYDSRENGDVRGFSLTTFPRTVQGVCVAKKNLQQTTPTLNKLENIFRKLDLVMAWKN